MVTSHSDTVAFWEPATFAISYNYDSDHAYTIHFFQTVAFPPDMFLHVCGFLLPLYLGKMHKDLAGGVWVIALRWVCCGCFDAILTYVVLPSCLHYFYGYWYRFVCVCVAETGK